MELFVVIPCHNEPNIVSALNSLAACTPPENIVTVIVVVNSGEHAPYPVIKQNQQSLADLKQWKHSAPKWIRLKYSNLSDVPQKLAGVGHARKVGMDQAYHNMNDPKNGIIICFDADCTCSKNYLMEIERSFKLHPKHDVATLYFEHEITNNPAIIDYELFLRYHYQGLRYAGYPFAYQTIGSSMAVRGNTYNAFGGMNTRKAGEDFYFLHKIIPYRNVIEINGCAVLPSPRTSDRVPFGTGHAVTKYNTSVCNTYYTYDPDIYVAIKHLVNRIKESTVEEGIDFKGIPKPILDFLRSEGWLETEQKLQKQSKNDVLFQQNVFRWLNGFRMLKLVHYLRDTWYTNIPIHQAVARFWTLAKNENHNKTNAEWLSVFRELEKSTSVSSS